MNFLYTSKLYNVKKTAEVFHVSKGSVSKIYNVYTKNEKKHHSLSRQQCGQKYVLDDRDRQSMKSVVTETKMTADKKQLLN